MDCRATDDDRTLLRDFARSRDDAAFAAIVARYGPMVAATARRQVPDVHRADDVAQAVFLILARRASTIDGSLGAWLHRATRLTARNANRVDARRRRHEREAIVQRPPQIAETSRVDADLLIALDAALDALPSRDREVIGLRFFESLGVAEIARRLGVNAEAAKKRLARATDRLRGRLAGREATLVVAALATLAAPPDAAAFVVTSTPGAQTIAKGTLTMMKQIAIGKTIAAASGFALVAAVAAQVTTDGANPQAMSGAPTSRPSPTVSMRLANGVTFELLAVSSSEHPGRWWRPDGAPTTAPALSPLPTRPTYESGTTTYFVARSTTPDARPYTFPTAREVPYAARGGGPYNAVTTARMQLAPAGAGYGASTAHHTLFERNGAPGTHATDVEFGVAVGEWQPVVTLDRAGERIGAYDGTSTGFEWTAPALIDGQPTITVILIGRERRPIRVVAIDHGGATHESAFDGTRATSNVHSERMQRHSARFNLPPERVARYEIQQKPIGLVRVVDVALQPDANTRPAAQDPTQDSRGDSQLPIERLAFDQTPLDECLTEIAAIGGVTIDPPHWPSLQDHPQMPGPRSPVTLVLTNATPPTAVRAAFEAAGLHDFTVVVSPDGRSIRVVRGAFQPTFGNYGSLPPPTARE